MASLPTPPVPSDIDLRDFAFMPLDVARLRDSRIVDEISGDEFRAAVLLWCASWHQVPAGSLPDDDIQLAKFAGYGRVVDVWMEIKEGALHGFEKSSDGRLYHSVILEKVVNAWNRRLRELHRRERARTNKARLRAKEAGEDMASIPECQPFEEWLRKHYPATADAVFSADGTLILSCGQIQMSEGQTAIVRGTSLSQGQTPLSEGQTQMSQGQTPMSQRQTHLSGGKRSDRDRDRDRDRDSKGRSIEPPPPPHATGSEHERATPITASSQDSRTGPPEETRREESHRSGEDEGGFSRENFDRLVVTLPRAGR